MNTALSSFQQVECSDYESYDTRTAPTPAREDSANTIGLAVWVVFRFCEEMACSAGSLKKFFS